MISNFLRSSFGLETPGHVFSRESTQGEDEDDDTVQPSRHSVGAAYPRDYQRGETH